MNEQEAEDLLQKLSKEYSVPMPKVKFIKQNIVMTAEELEKYRRKSKKEATEGYPHFHIETKNITLPLIACNPGDPFTTDKELVVHEFFHYLDCCNGVESDEKSVQSRTRQWLKREEFTRRYKEEVDKKED